MLKKYVKTSTLVWALLLGGLILPQMALAHPPVQLLDRNGTPIVSQLNASDTVQAANGSVYMRGPAYSPKQTCDKCHDYQAITRAYHFREGAGPDGKNLSDRWSAEHQNDRLYKTLAGAYGHLVSPGQLGAWCPPSYRQVAAKKERGSLNDPFTSEGKPYFFDLSLVDQMTTCYSCHPGGGPAEGIVQADGTVTPYTDPSLSPAHSYDRDFYTYGPNTVAEALESPASIEETITAIGAPKRHDWNKSGVMEADCLLCHIDPESPYTLRAADGLKAQPFRPRLMIFAKRQGGKITSISLGMPLQEGLLAQTVLNYTNDPQRRGRPTNMLALAKLPSDVMGQMMQMWTDGLKEIEASGISLPYALYGANVAKIWDASGSIKAAYCANLAGPADEMARLAAAGPEINNLFAGLLDLMKSRGLLSADATMDRMMAVFFNNFIYGYKIKDKTGNLLPIPVPLRAYELGKFYTDWDNPEASVRDYVRFPLVEGEGIPYLGKVGLGWEATMYAVGMAMQGDTRYMDANGRPDVAAVMTDLRNGAIAPDAIRPVLHDYLPSFFYMMPTAQLMGLDFNHDGAPLTYVRIDKVDGQWQAKAYYNVSDLGDGFIRMPMFGGYQDIDSYKWVRICGQCHVMTKDDGNSGWNKVRTYNLGMSADWVKAGLFINFTDDAGAPGYDVHMSSKKMGCGTCHLRREGSVEDKHNFLKGTGVHMVRNDLDNNLKPKTCEGCHLMGEDPEAPNPSRAHEEKFGENTGRHMAEMACEVCHTPYRRTWRFRAFDDSMGYYGNFDNRFGYNVLPGGDGKMMAFPREYAISPVYAASPSYGIPHFNPLAQHIDADGAGVVPMDFVSQMVDYFNFSASADPGRIVNGMSTNFRFDFWKYFYQKGLDQYASMGVPLSYDPAHDNEVFPTLYYANGRNGYPQIVAGNPVTILTWVDANPEPDHDMSSLAYRGAKVLYLREINAAIRTYVPPVQAGAVDPTTLANIPANDPAWAQDPNVGKIILKDSGYVIFDHTGDMYPELWWPEDVRAMQEALTKVLKAEGETDPRPVLFLAAHYFSDSHGVLPANQALGSKSCYDCHGDYTRDPGAHRVTDREIVCLPWAPPWFKDKNRAMKYDPQKGMVPANPDGLFIVDGEVAYIEPVQANGLRFLGAKASDVLKLSKHHAEELFYLLGKEKVTGHDLVDVDQSLLSTEELDTVYTKQLVNGPWQDRQWFYIPEDLKAEVAECGFQPQAEFVYLAGRGLAEGYILRLGFNTDVHESMIIKLPFTGANPQVWTKIKGDYAFRQDRDAVIVGYRGGYVLVKVNQAGEFVCVEKGVASAVNADLWKAFMMD